MYVQKNYKTIVGIVVMGTFHQTYSAENQKLKRMTAQKTDYVRLATFGTFGNLYQAEGMQPMKVVKSQGLETKANCNNIHFAVLTFIVEMNKIHENSVP